MGAVWFSLLSLHLLLPWDAQAGLLFEVFTGEGSTKQHRICAFQHMHVNDFSLRFVFCS